MKIINRTILALAVSTSVAMASGPVGAAPKDIVLLPETVELKPSPLPGHDIAMQKCGICHSADYVAYQPPSMTLTQWTAEMAKMQHAYGAPISDDEVRLLGVYLASAYGDAKTVSDADRALKPVVVMAAQPADAGASGPGRTSDSQALLAANGCPACHAIDRKVVGPAFHEVALKYRTDPQAIAHVTASILQGGSGKWGPVPMPPFANLPNDDALALAAYVLKR